MKMLRYAAVLGLGLLPLVATAQAGDYSTVTDARLTNPEPENWLMTRGNYQGWSYSALDQINTANVGKTRTSAIIPPRLLVQSRVAQSNDSPAIVTQRAAGF